MAKEKVAQDATVKMGFGAKFMHWYDSYNGKKAVGMIYSIGASVVIIGALFKILHWPGASTVLMIGMFTEAFLFIIGCLDKPHTDFHWEHVFPQLMGYGTEPNYLKELEKMPRPTLLGAGVENPDGTKTEGNSFNAAPANNAQGSVVPTAAPLADDDANALRKGIAELSKTANQLADLGKVAAASSKLGEQMEIAATATGKFAASADQLSDKNDKLAETYTAIVNDMQGVAANTRSYTEGVAAVNNKLAGMNSVYELQLNALQAQADAIKEQTAQVKSMSAGMEKMAASAAEALKSSAEYEAGAKKLAAQIADLNKVYGNMLNALA